MIVLEPTQFLVVVSIAAPNENVGHPGGAIIGDVIEHGGNPDVLLAGHRASRTSPSRSRRAARLNLAVVSLCRTLCTGRYWTRKEDEELERG